MSMGHVQCALARHQGEDLAEVVSSVLCILQPAHAQAWTGKGSPEAQGFLTFIFGASQRGTCAV